MLPSAFHRIFTSQASLDQSAGGSTTSDLDSEPGLDTNRELFPWLLVAGNEFGLAKAFIRKLAKHQSANLIEIFRKFIDLLQNYQLFKWAVALGPLQVLRKETTNLFDGTCRVVARLSESTSSSSSPGADVPASTSTASVSVTMNAILLVIRLRLALIDVYLSISSSSSSSSSSTDVFGDLLELATSICEFNKACKPYVNPVLCNISLEISLLWYISISHAAISKHEIMSAIMAFYCSKQVFRRMSRQWEDLPAPSASRLDTFLQDLYKKLNYKIGICFYKTLHAKELAMIQSLGQKTVRFSADIKLPYLLPLLDLHDSFKPLNMNILYLPNDFLKKEEGAANADYGNGVIDLSLLIKTHYQLFDEITLPPSAISADCVDSNVDRIGLFSNPSTAPSTTNLQQQASIYSLDTPPATILFKQGFECESIEKIPCKGLKSIPVVFSYPQDEVPLDYLPSIISLLLHYTRYPVGIDSAATAIDPRLFMFSFASLPQGMSPPSPGSALKHLTYLPHLRQGLALGFIDRDLDICIVFARLDDDYLLTFVIRTIILPLNNQKLVALTKILQAIARTFNPFLQ